jgi:hypothetical protein
LKLLSFDIEIYDELTDEIDKNRQLSTIRPSIAALATNEDDVEYFYDEPFMSVDTAKKLVHKMMDYHNQGYLVYGWNIVSFDLRLIGYYSGMLEECGHLAMTSVDPMCFITFNKGYYLGLDAALTGANLETKTHKVCLNDGTLMEDMSGMKAPQMWKDGEIEAVKTYLKGDVIQPLKLARIIETNNGIKWFSKTGKPMYVPSKMDQFKDLFMIRTPNNSWMDNPPQRKDFINWIPENVLSEYGIYLDYV